MSSQITAQEKLERINNIIYEYILSKISEEDIEEIKIFEEEFKEKSILALLALSEIMLVMKL